jgi:hypothetical protein
VSWSGGGGPTRSPPAMFVEGQILPSVMQNLRRCFRSMTRVIRTQATSPYLESAMIPVKRPPGDDAIRRYPTATGIPGYVRYPDCYPKSCPQITDRRLPDEGARSKIRDVLDLQASFESPREGSKISFGGAVIKVIRPLQTSQYEEDYGDSDFA